MKSNDINALEIAKLIGSPLSNGTCSLGSIGVDKDTIVDLLQVFTSRLAELLHEAEKTGTEVLEIAKRQDAVFTNSGEMAELHPSMDCLMDDYENVKAIRIDEYELLPSDLSFQELAFVQSWFSTNRGVTKSVWISLIEETLREEENLDVTILGNYPKSVGVFFK